MSDLIRSGYYDQSLPPDILVQPPPVAPPATGATEVPGGAGDFTPPGCETPTIAQLTSNPVVASPLTAWSAGSHMAATDGNAFWDGTAWAAGIAAAAGQAARAPRRRNGPPA
jgi:hypothetical protein